MTELLRLCDLQTQFGNEKSGIVQAADRVSFSLKEGETLAIVGESGSGKSVTALSIMRLIPSPPGRITGGRILFQGEDLLRKTPEEMRKIRGNLIAMIFQEPMTSLNPVLTIRHQLTEAIRLHTPVGKNAAYRHAVSLLERVEVPDAKRRMRSYPHELSGGLRQRVMICMALACNPKLLIADEPTTALDVTVQAQILDLLRSIREERHMSVLFITHDLGVVADIAHRVIVMYAGRVVESAPVHQLFKEPLHPYTRSLIRAIPRLSTPRKQALYTIPGIVPNLAHLPAGCAFSDRCDQCAALCHQQPPELRTLQDGRQVRCHMAKGGIDHGKSI